MIAVALVVGCLVDLLAFNFQTLLSLGNREVRPTSERMYVRDGDVYHEYTFDRARIGNVRIRTDLPEDFQGHATLAISVEDEGNADPIRLDQGDGEDLYFDRDVTYGLESSGGVKRLIIRVNPVVPAHVLDLNDPNLLSQLQDDGDYGRFFRDAVKKGMGTEAASQLARDQVLHKAEVEASVPVKVRASFNVVRPLEPSPYRIVGVACAVLLLMALAPASPLWRRRFDDRRFAIAVGFAGAATASLLVATHLSFVNSGLANERQYLELARALAHGRVYLDARPSKELLAMANPYDFNARRFGSVPYLWDHALFHGRYYVYFGALPALVFHLPFYLLAGQMFPNALADALCGRAFAAGLSRLLLATCRRWFRGCSQALFLACYAVLFMGSWTFFIGYYPGHYVLPIAMGLALLAWGLSCWIGATAGERIAVRDAVLGSALVSLTVASRPQLMVGGSFGAALLLDHMRRYGFRRDLPCALAALAPVLVVFALQGVYNAARFGHALDFGANYNLTGDDMTHRGWILSRALAGIFPYLLQPPSLVAAYPFIRPAAFATDSIAATVTEPMLGGLVGLFPVLALAAAPICRRVRRAMPAGTLPLVAIGVACAVALALFDANGAGILPRYQLDMGFFVALGAVLVALSVSGSAGGTGDSLVVGRSRLTLLGGVLGALFVLSLANQVLLII